MNILYIHTHDTGCYIQPYGYSVPTPHLMNFAREATLFRSAFSVAPTCSPSRTGLLTGKSPHAAGMIGLAHRGFELRDYSQHLVQYLNKFDYETVLCGFQHEAPAREMIGYKRILNNQSIAERSANHSSDIENAYKVAKFLKNNNKKMPFFLSFGMTNTHRPFPELDNELDWNYVMPPFPIYDTSENRQDMAKYIKSASIVDQCVGIVLEALGGTELREQTMIIFTTDHGPAFPNMKCTLYDTGIGVSLIVDYPGNRSRGAVIDSLVSQLDIFPTICELAEIPLPDWLEGSSFLPLTEKKKDRIRDHIFGEVTYHAAYEPMRCIRTERYKLIKFYGEHEEIVPANIDDGLSKSFLINHSFLERHPAKEQLYDIYLDPVERVNLVGDDRYQEIYQDLLSRLEDWMVKTDDPLLNGVVKKPEGAVVNKLECISPEEDNFE